MSSAEVTLEGGPLDGQVQTVPRGPDGQLPAEVKAHGLGDVPDDGDNLPVIEYRWTLVSDVGQLARYVYAGSRSG